MDKKVLIQDLADGLVARRGLSKEDAEVFVRSVFEIIGEYLQADKIVKVKGLGTFKLVTVDSRESVDVNTGERIVIKEYTKVNFTPDPALRDAVNKPFAQFETVILYDGTDIADMERMDFPETAEDSGEENVPALPESVASEEVEAPVEFLDESREEPSVAQAEKEEPSVVAIETAPIEIEEETKAEEPVEGDAAEENEEVKEANSGLQGNENGETHEPVAPVETVADKAEAEPVPLAPSQPEEEQEEEPEAAVQSGTEAQEADEKAGGQKEAVGMEAFHKEKVHVATQQIEVQNVEHQKVEHQHIFQVAPEHDSRRRVYLTPWMMFFAILFVLLLMAISYYVGYHHLFNGEKAAPQAPPTVVRQAGVDKPVTRPSAKKDTLRAEPDTVMPVQKKEERLPEKPVEEKPRPQGAPKAPVEYPQVKGGAYEIVGTQEMHRVRGGETLRGLALKYYGSKDFTVYLVVYNKIANPDLVPEGMALKIPELELKRR